jgi:hypothetical protein
MAVGDAAAAKGLATYTSAQSASLGYQNDNQRGDDIAATMTRLDIVEKAAVGTPAFGVKRSTSGQQIGGQTWSKMNAGAWRTPDINRGFTSWSDGVLTVARTAVYSINGLAHFYNDDFYTVAVQVIKNGGQPDDQALAVVKGEWSSAQTSATQISPTAQATDLAVPLVAGDTLSFWVLQRNVGNETWNTGPSPYDMTWQVTWLSD